MRSIITPAFIFTAFFLSTSLSAQSFEQQQLAYSRVRQAKQNTHHRLATEFKDRDFPFPPKEMFIRVFKHEQVLELWVRNGPTFKLFKVYPICRSSGKPGPKRREGDQQVPEGFYFISAFNPVSSYHLSLKINYPNDSDKILGDPVHPGGNIMIHGNCVTIGCIPMTDRLIEEIYWLSVLARSGGQPIIRVHIFPFRMEASNMAIAGMLHKNNSGLPAFWQNLKEGYDYFEKNRTTPVLGVDAGGRYSFR